MIISTLRPGLLVSLHTSLKGNIRYATNEIESDHIEEDGSRQARWETLRVIEQPAEHEAATKVRGKARSLISAVCSPSSFGLLCPERERDKLTDAISEARAIVDEFNREATVTQVALYVIIGRVAADDVEAVRAINSEVRDLLDRMESGLKRLDVEAVRDAANRARALSGMLSPEAAEKAQKAIAAARSAARQIVKAGETAAQEIDAATLARIRESRAAFLDFDEAGEVQEPEVTGRALDLEMEETPPVQVTAPAAPSFQIEL